MNIISGGVEGEMHRHFLLSSYLYFSGCAKEDCNIIKIALVSPFTGNPTFSGME